MKLPKEAHTSRPWRIHEVAPDFDLEDVWALPTPGGPEDFPLLVQMVTSFDPAQASSPTVRGLFAIRRRLGTLLAWDESSAGTGSRAPTLRERLPADLLGAEPESGFQGTPFTALYQTDDEFAAEVANQTVHGVIHLGWVATGSAYRGQMAILVKRNGLLGGAYMAAIAPFRYAIVYPSLLRELGRTWRAVQPVRRAG